MVEEAFPCTELYVSNGCCLLHPRMPFLVFHHSSHPPIAVIPLIILLDMHSVLEIKA